MCPGNTATSLMESSHSPFPPKTLRTWVLIHGSVNVIEIVQRCCLTRFEMRGGPDFDAFQYARYDDFFLQVRVFTKETGNHDATLCIDRAGHGAGGIESAQPLGIGIEAGRVDQPLFEGGPFIGREQSEMISLVDQHRWTFPPAYELTTEDSWYAESSFGVDGVIMSPSKHRSISASYSNRFRMLMNALMSGSLELPCPGPNSEVPRRPT